jgi:hypothetical protein
VGVVVAIAITAIIVILAYRSDKKKDDKINTLLSTQTEDHITINSQKRVLGEILSRLPNLNPSEQIQQKISQLNNSDLLEHAMDLSQNMKRFADNYRFEIDTISASLNHVLGALHAGVLDPMPKDRQAYEQELLSRMKATLIPVDNKYESKFKSIFLDDAIATRNELLKRLPSQVSISEQKEILPAFKGILIGPQSVSDAVDYLEKLTGEFPK